jgi:hypothetical protein
MRFPSLSLSLAAAAALWLVLAALKNVHVAIVAVKLVRWLTSDMSG